MLGTSLAEPVWQRFEVQVAAAIYLAMAIITIIVFLSMRRSVLRFRGLARDIRTGHAGNRSFASQNELVELSGVAEEFDHLIAKLRASADSIRHAAEDNAHAMKTPIAIMRQSLEPLKRLVPSGEPRGPARHRGDRELHRTAGPARVLGAAHGRGDGGTAGSAAAAGGCVAAAAAHDRRLWQRDRGARAALCHRPGRQDRGARQRGAAGNGGGEHRRQFHQRLAAGRPHHAGAEARQRPGAS